VFVEEVKSLSEAAKSSGEAYQWLPNGVLPALAYVAAAAIWRPVGKFAPGKELLTTALDFLRAAERAAGLDMFHKVGSLSVDPDTTGFAALDAVAAWTIWGMLKRTCAA